MSDLKAKFRAAQAQRGIPNTSKEQLRALKEQRLRQRTQEVQTLATTTAVVSAAPVASTSGRDAAGSSGPKRELHSSNGLASYDFEPILKKQAVPGPSGAPTAAQPSSSVQPPPASAPHPAPGAAGGGNVSGFLPAAAVVALPQGFFDDKAADNKAQGIKPMKPKDVEAELAAFQRAVEEGVVQAAAAEEAESAEAAAEREAREAFEQRLRMKRVEVIRLKRDELTAAPEIQAAAGAVNTDMLNSAAAVAAALDDPPVLSLEVSHLPGKLRRGGIAAQLRAQMDAADEASGNESEGGEDFENELLNWRAKTV